MCFMQNGFVSIYYITTTVFNEENIGESPQGYCWLFDLGGVMDDPIHEECKKTRGESDHEDGAG